jgi:GUN4-like
MSIAGLNDLEDLRPEDIRRFPCNDLQVMDPLWASYSGDRFGFSIQLRAYQDVGGTLETTIEQNTKLIERWGEKLGWCENNTGLSPTKVVEFTLWLQNDQFFLVSAYLLSTSSVLELSWSARCAGAPA